MRQLLERTSIVCLCLATLAMAGCRQRTPEEQVEKLRSRYSARINESGFFVRDVPVEPVEIDEGMEEPGDAGEPTAEDAAAEAFAEPATRQEILLDIIVQHDSNETLPGVTVDLELSDPEGNIKKQWRIWVETEGLPKANQKQVTETLVDIGYEEGDRFNAEIRPNIPPGERSEYREFAEYKG